MKINFSKLDSAKRQLETAIDLFFKNEDPVSIHTLACAAHEILEVILGERGVNSMHKELIGSIKEEKRDFVFKKINEAKNFFKHGARDVNKTISFDPELSTYFIWDACQLYEKLTNEKVKRFFIFTFFFGIKNKDYFLVLNDFLTKNQVSLNTENRLEFYINCSAAYDRL